MIPRGDPGGGWAQALRTPVVVAMALVTASFAGSLVYSQYLEREIDDLAVSITQDVPRSEHLAEARRAMAAATQERLAAAAPLPLNRPLQISASLDQVRAELAGYAPGSPQEADEIAAVRQGIGQLQDGVARLPRSSGTLDLTAALAQFDREARPLEARIDQTLTSLRRLNDARIQAQSGRIVSLRARAARTTLLLGILSLALAAAITTLVVQMLAARARQAAEQQRLMAERAAELESFAGRVAHDLRDPLNAALLSLQVLERCPEAPPAGSQLVRVRGQLGRMTAVIDGLLEFARSGARPQPGAQASLPAVLEDVLSSLRPAAQAAGLELRIGPLIEVPLAVTPAALGSVLANLLSNAVKYVGEGRLLPHRVSVRASTHAGLALIEIEDNGPGLPADAAERVFEPFVRLPSGQPGTGLGLATVKRIVEAYQGRVGVSAVPGLGSTFWIEIPCCRSAHLSPPQHVLARSSGTAAAAARE